MNTIEQQLWDYIDGNLDATQTSAIEEKINSDAAIKFQYTELLNFNSALNHLEIDEPSMSFTRRVMDNIVLERAPITLKTKVNTNIIYGIGGFFLCSLTGLFGYVLYHSNITLPEFNFGKILVLRFDQYLTPTTLYAFLFADLVIGLVYLDYFFRKRANHKQF